MASCAQASRGVLLLLIRLCSPGGRIVLLRFAGCGRLMRPLERSEVALLRSLECMACASWSMSWSMIRAVAVAQKTVTEMLLLHISDSYTVLYT